LFQREFASVSSLFGVSEVDPPIDVVLDATAGMRGCSALGVLDGGTGRVRGWAVGGREIHIAVPQEYDGLYLLSADDTFRHEISHVLLSRRGVGAAPWFDEGLAHEIGRAVHSESGLALHPVPLCAIAARDSLGATSLERLSRWTADPAAIAEDEGVLRCLSQAAVRYLIERDGQRDWPGRIGALAQVDLAGASGIASDYVQWLNEFDLAERVALGLSSSDSAIRAAAAQSLVDFQQLRSALVPESASAAAIGAEMASADRVAEGLLSDASFRDVAGRYFVLFRPHSLDDAVVRDLAGASAHPAEQLVGRAVMARRGAFVEPEEVQRLWHSLSRRDRARWLWLKVAFPELALDS
jgi:hypothetical protein